MATALLFETIPGGELEGLARLSYDDDPKAFLQAALDALEAHHPTVYDRVDQARFGVRDGRDVLQGAIVPTVRESSVALDDDTIAVALGDVHAVMDPMVGQGANMASYAAEIMGEEIVAQDVFHARFVETVDRQRSDRVFSALRWTNFMMAPPPDEMLELIGTMSQDRALADEFTVNFNYPEKQWDRLASTARIRAWLDEREAARAGAARATA